MERKMLALVLSALMITIAAAGCLGGDDEVGETDPDEGLTLKSGEPITDSAWVQSSQAASIEDVTVRHQISMSIPRSRIKTASFQINLKDGCGDREIENTETQPDVLMAGKVVGGGGENETGAMGFEEQLPGGGQTPLSLSVDFRAREGDSLPSSWEIHLEVSIRAGEDQWPGPLMWFGTPDEGFCYDITLEYTYMAEE